MVRVREVAISSRIRGRRRRRRALASGAHFALGGRGALGTSAG